MRTYLKLLVAGILSLAMVAGASAAGKVTDVSVRELTAGSAVHIGGQDIPKPAGQWDDGAFIMEFEGELVTKGETVRPNSATIKSLSFAQLGSRVSIAVRPNSVIEPAISRTEDGWLVAFHAKGVDEVLCSLQVAEMDPARILQTLSAQTGANLVLLTKPDTKLTIRLSKVPLSEMIGHICAMCDLAFVRIGGAYIIATPEKLKAAYPKEWDAAHPVAKPELPPPADLVTETYDTSFTSGEEIVKALEKIYAGKGLVFVAGPSPLRPEIGSQDPSKTTGTSTSILTQTTTTDDAARLVVITGDRALVESAISMAKQLDKPRKQVSIAVTIHDISNDALDDIGISWNFSDINIKESNPNGINFGKFGRTPFALSATLNALVKKGKSKLLASPNVSVLDRERAFVLIGDRISYPVLVGYSQNNAPIFSKEEERVGIYLQVSATIGQDGSVTLSLYPQVSTVTGYLTVNGASYPQISTREAQTTLRVQTGETIVMGGLFSDEDIATVEKVPFLSQIPLLGAIFQHRKVTKTKSQVIITVTPTVLTEPQK